jgi:hypothetical protein
MHALNLGAYRPAANALIWCDRAAVFGMSVRQADSIPCDAEAFWTAAVFCRFRFALGLLRLKALPRRARFRSPQSCSIWCALKIEHEHEQNPPEKPFVI